MARQERRFLQTKSELLSQRFGSGRRKLDLSLIWDGDGRNRNAALTIFRHFDSASVVQGLVGEPPKTAWVIDYPLFERIYYLLVAGYDVFGNVGHQLNSRLYMDFMRMEGEFNFLVLLPQARARAHARCTGTAAPPARRASTSTAKTPISMPRVPCPTAARSRSASCYELLRRRLAPVLDERFDLAGVPDAALRGELHRLAAVKGASLSWLPEMSVLRIDAAGAAPRYFTLLRNTAHANVAHLAREKAELLPDENTLTVVPGFIGAYPNAIYHATVADLPRTARGHRRPGL